MHFATVHWNYLQKDTPVLPYILIWSIFTLITFSFFKPKRYIYNITLSFGTTSSILLPHVLYYNPFVNSWQCCPFLFEPLTDIDINFKLINKWPHCLAKTWYVSRISHSMLHLYLTALLSQRFFSDDFRIFIGPISSARILHTGSVARFESFRALKPSRFESLRTLKWVFSHPKTLQIGG